MTAEAAQTRGNGRYSLHVSSKGGFNVYYLDLFVEDATFCSVVEEFIEELELLHNTIDEDLQPTKAEYSVETLNGSKAAKLQQVLLILWETVPKFIVVPEYRFALEVVSLCLDYLTRGSYIDYMDGIKIIFPNEELRNKYSDPCLALADYTDVMASYIDLYPKQAREIVDHFGLVDAPAEEVVPIGFTQVKKEEASTAEALRNFDGNWE